MREFRCRDIGMDCDYVMFGNSDEEVMKKAREHGKQLHGLQTLSTEMEQQVRSKIHDREPMEERPSPI